ncbi:hypothetical protein EsH8_IV_001426 [Colletotrichum jinshuiense]
MDSHTPYAAFIDPISGHARMGLYDLNCKTIQPLSFLSGTPVLDLYQVIEAGASNIVSNGDPIPAQQVKILAPIQGRDILAVGKNYMEHAKEFNSSGYDSSDRVDRPSQPVIFTKRATSIIADGVDILPHPDFTQTLDYEGEVGVIIGKPGFKIHGANAWDHVWGYTIINDMTARERQRDHKQFFLGKSPDTFCPIGPIAVPKEQLPTVLDIETRVNGETRQKANTNDLIFSIPTLIEAISQGQTLQLGDVIATGTPAGVGIGKVPPVFLKPGDEVAVSVTGLGTLRNKIAAPSATNPIATKVSSTSFLNLANAEKSFGTGRGLLKTDGKILNYQKLGSGSSNVVFVHGLGGTLEYWTPLISNLKLYDTHSLHLFDLEGHGLSPTHPLSDLTVKSMAADVRSIFDVAEISATHPGTLVAHSLGCLIALQFALENPGLLKKLVLLGPPHSPLPKAAVEGCYARAALVRAKGMTAVTDAIVQAGTSESSKKTNHVGTTAIRLSLLGQDPESYAKACWALARAPDLQVELVATETLIVTGDEDKVSPPEICQQYIKIATTNGDLVAGITRFADGPSEMKQVVRYNIEEIGVDNVKLSMSGEEITGTRAANDCYFTDEETAACVEEAHSLGKRLCSHARARDSIKMSVKHGVDVIYHASFVDDEGMDMLQRAKDKSIIVPALNWLVATSFEAEAFGYTKAAAEKAGYVRELDIAVAGLREMHRRGIVILPGGDYGFAWTPHGTYARDLEHFVELLGFTPHESIIAATAGVAALLMRSHELGKIQPGYLADCILIDVATVFQNMYNF